MAEDSPGKLPAISPALVGVQLPDIHTAPGHLIRVAQRVHTSLWFSKLQSDITSIQYACLMVLHDDSAIDQGTLGMRVCLDKASVADIVRRMVSARLVQRSQDPDDKRRWRLGLTPEGETVLAQERQAVIDVQRSILSPLSAEESGEWVRLLSTVVSGEPVPAASPEADDLVLISAPGHLIRRAQQKHWSLWSALVSKSVTSVQYASLLALIKNGPMDQRSLGTYLSIDKSTAAEMVSRMHQRRLIERTRDERDRRKNMLSVNDIGIYVVKALASAVFDVQDQLFDGLSAFDRQMFIDLMTRICSQYTE